jgi:hypothetical protein
MCLQGTLGIYCYYSSSLTKTEKKKEERFVRDFLVSGSVYIQMTLSAVMTSE